MKMATICAGLLALCMAWSVRAGEVHEKLYSVGADVDAQGQITATQFEQGVSASVAKVLAAAARQWRFAPAKVDGRAVPTHTFIRVKLRATPNAKGGYSLSISYAGNGPRLDRKGVLPVYPQSARRTHESAFLWLYVTVQPDGSFADVKVTSRFREWRVLNMFKQSTLAALEQWRATPERVDGHAVATQVRIPVSFTLDPPEYTPQQRQILRAYERQAAANKTADLVQPSEQAVALDSPLQPQSVGAVQMET